MNIVLGITGSVSAYKTPWLIRDLRKAGHDVRVVATPSATEFVTPLALEATSTNPVVVDPYAAEIQHGGSWHVHLAQWADVMLIAPCSATTLARLASGLADNALMTVVFSREKTTPILVAPAMDTDMWLQPSVARNITQVEEDGVVVIPPESGELASGLVGTGRLPEISTLVDIVNAHDLQSNGQPRVVRNEPTSNVAGLRIVVSAGPTHEPIDPVRSIVNHSTGTMGFAIAEAAAIRGMLVTLVAGPTFLPTPRGVERVNVVSAANMHEAMITLSTTADVVVMAAAVADYTPTNVATQKMKKSEASLTLQLQPTVDILADLGAKKTPSQTIVGFALETNDLIENATKKLASKNADIIIANEAGVTNSGFGTGHNTITIITPNAAPAPFPAMSKRACAEVVLDAIIAHRGLEC